MPGVSDANLTVANDLEESEEKMSQIRQKEESVRSKTVRDWPSFYSFHHIKMSSDLQFISTL